MPDFYAVPGDTFTVEVEADENGDVATENDAVEIVGSHNRNPLVELVGGRATDIGVLAEDPEDYDSSTTYSAGDKVGKAEMIVAKTIIPVNADSAYTPTVGDYVTATDGGDYTGITGPVSSGVGTLTNSLGVDNNGNLENDTTGDIELDITGGIPSGVVFDVGIPEFNTADMAVALIR